MAPWVCSARFGLAIIGFFGFVCFFFQRNSISVAIVCMVNHTALREMHEDPLYNLTQHGVWTNGSLGAEDEEEGGCILQKGGGGDDVKDGPFAFTKSQQGVILGSFYYGYVVSQVPGGMLAERYGGKWIFVIFTIIATFGTMITPLAARIHFGFLVFARVLVGIGSGGIFPVMHSIFGKWAPPNERSKLSAISYAGMPMGTVIIMPFAGVLCTYGFSDGWDSVFYVCGLISTLWMCLWILLIGSTPNSCRIISADEKDYINSTLRGQVEETKKTKPTPWPKVLRSKAVWSIIIGMFTADWGFYTLMTNIPTYMFEVLKFDIQSSGWYSALPFIANWINMNVSALIADYLITSKKLSIAKTRKLFSSIGTFGAGFMLILVGFIPCTHSHLAILCLTLGTGLWSSGYSGVFVSSMDIAPQYAGSLMGIANSVSAAGGFIAPSVAAAITKDQSRESWLIVFFVSAAIFSVGNIVFLIFGSDQLEDWAVEEILEENGDEKQQLEKMLSNGSSDVKV